MKILLVFITILFVSNTALAKPDKESKRSELPPGLEKKVQRGGKLPPGWEKKLIVGKPIDIEVYEQRRVVIPVDDKGLITVEIGGKLIRLHEATKEIIEILK